MEKLRVSAVSYANSIPFVYGLIHSDIIHDIYLSLDTPAVCAQKLLNGEAEIGEVPVAVLPELPNYHIISDYCIGGRHHVKTVMLVSQVPLNRLRVIYLDAESRTSVMLARILAHKFWHIQVEWKICDMNRVDDLVGEDRGAVLIGDKTFQIGNGFLYQYDLADEWRIYTGKSFVFACWAAIRSLGANMKQRFNQALDKGINHITDAIQYDNSGRKHHIDMQRYLTENISYKLDREKMDSLRLFLKWKSQLPQGEVTDYSKNL